MHKDKSERFETQCWICPYCHDDHGRTDNCYITDLQLRIDRLVESEISLTLKLREKMKSIYILSIDEMYESKKTISVHLTLDGARAAALKYISTKEPDTGTWTIDKDMPNTWEARGGDLALEIEEWGINQ